MNTTPSRIIIRSPNWVGDAVMATPVFRCIRESFPSSEIALVTRPYVKDVVKGAPWFDEVIDCDDKTRVGALRGAKSYLSFVKRLRGKAYDLGVILPNSFSSALMFWMANVKRRVGYERDARRFLLTDSIPRPSEDGEFSPSYMADYYLALCSIIGCRIGDRRLELFVTDEAEREVDQLLAERGVDLRRPIVIISPGAAYGSSKYWSDAKFAEVGDALVERRGCQILIVGSPADAKTADSIASRMKCPSVNLASGRAPLSLHAVKSLVRRCSLLVTLDSGLRHVAVAFERPSVVIMGPTDPRYTDSKYERGVIIRAEVECAPCQLKVCPTDHACMTRITADQVVEACQKILDEQAAPRAPG